MFMEFLRRSNKILFAYLKLRLLFIIFFLSTLIFCPVSFSVGQENRYADVVERHRLSVVFIQVKGTNPDSGGTLEGSATGFVACNTDGIYVLTNHHIILGENRKAYRGNPSIEGSIGSRYKTKFPMTIISEDKTADLLLLKFELGSGQFSEKVFLVKFASSQSVESGSSLYSLGYPVDSDLFFRSGTLSNKTYVGDFWVADLLLSYGDSGEPVFNDLDQVVAVAKGVLIGKDEHSERISVLIPIYRAHNLLDITPCNGITLSDVYFHTNSGKVFVGELVGSFESAQLPKRSINMFIDTSQPMKREAFDKLSVLQTKFKQKNKSLPSEEVQGEGNIFYNRRTNSLYFHSRNLHLIELNLDKGHEKNWGITIQK